MALPLVSACRSGFPQAAGVPRCTSAVQAEYRPQVALPSSVHVIQDTGGFYGKGTTESNDNEALFARARAYLEELRPSRPAVVTHMHLRDRASALRTRSLRPVTA